MLLTKIKEEFCPICGSDPIQENKKNRHTNGHWNESRVFSCGLEISFSPNFMKAERSKYRVCSKDPVEIAKKEKIKQAAKKLIAYIKKLDCDESFRKEMIEATEAKSRYC